MAGIRGLPISMKGRERGEEEEREREGEGEGREGWERERRGERESQFFDIDFLKGSITMIRLTTDSRIEHSQVSQTLLSKKIILSPEYVSILFLDNAMPNCLPSVKLSHAFCKQSYHGHIARCRVESFTEAPYRCLSSILGTVINYGKVK